jgi:hypothetical protein
MAKLEQPRLANATAEYSQTQLDQIIRTLEQMVLSLNTTFTNDAENKSAAESWFMMR